MSANRATDQIWEATGETWAERARTFYDANVAPTLTDEDRESIIVIDLVTGAFVKERDWSDAILKAVNLFGRGNLYTVKAGFRPAISVRVRPFRSEGEKAWLLEKSMPSVK